MLRTDQEKRTTWRQKSRRRSEEEASRSLMHEPDPSPEFRNRRRGRRLFPRGQEDGLSNATRGAFLHGRRHYCLCFTLSRLDEQNYRGLAALVSFRAEARGIPRISLWRRGVMLRKNGNCRPRPSFSVRIKGRGGDHGPPPSEDSI